MLTLQIFARANIEWFMTGWVHYYPVRNLANASASRTRIFTTGNYMNISVHLEKKGSGKIQLISHKKLSHRLTGTLLS